MNTGPIVSRRLADIWAANVRARREELGFSQDQVAELSCLTQAAVSQIERGAVLPRADSMVALARALGTDPGVLFPWPPMADLIEGAA